MHTLKEFLLFLISVCTEFIRNKGGDYFGAMEGFDSLILSLGR